MVRGEAMTVIERIEKLRIELVELGMKKGFQDPQVIKKSQQLDVIINQYYKLTERTLENRAG